jgi:hypothetical protein
VRFRPDAFALLLATTAATTVLGFAPGCASSIGPDDPAYDSEENSGEVLNEEEREWEDRDADL